MSEIKLQGKDKENQKIKGYKLITLEEYPFWSELSEQQQDEFLYDWNKLSDEKFKNKLENYYKLNPNEIDDIFQKIVLPSSYTSIGKRATKILLDYIKEDGLSYTEALNKAVKEKKIKIPETEIVDLLLPYHGKILPESTQMLIGKPFSKQFAKKNYKKPSINKDEKEFGKIANPVVHQTLNELRKIVNEIINIFGKKPLEIGLETSRELKKSKKGRAIEVKKQSENI